MSGKHWNDKKKIKDWCGQYIFNFLVSGKHWNDKKKLRSDVGNIILIFYRLKINFKHRFRFTFGLDKYEEWVEDRGI